MRFLVSLGIIGVLFVTSVSARDFPAIVHDLKSIDPAVVAAAVEELGKRGDDEAVKALISVVEAPVEDWKVQIRAINLLGEIGNPLAVDTLIDMMNDTFLSNECPALRWNAVRALGRFGRDKRVVAALLYRFEDKRDLYIREAVIRSLGETGDASLVPVLAPLLKDRSFALRMSALKALGNIGGQDAYSYIEVVAGEDSDPLIRQVASGLLKELESGADVTHAFLH